MGTKITIAVVLTLCLFAGTTARAQIVYGQPASGDLQLTYYSWTVTQDETERTISQLAFPLTGFVPAGENFDITLYAANASTTLDVDDGEQSLSGLSDVRVQANRAFADDQLLLSAGVNLPTGKTALDLEEEYFVLQALSQNYLEFPVRRYGEGFGFNVLLAGATVLGENLRGGAGVMYQYIGSYEPYDGFDDYNPGDVFSVNAGVDIDSEPLSWTFDAVYSVFTTDQLDGFKTFKQSPQFDLRVSTRYQGEEQSFSGLVRYLIRGDNTEFGDGEVELDAFKLYGNEFMIAGSYARQFARDWHVAPSLELRFIGGNDLDVESSSVFGAGARVGRALSDNFVIDGGFTWYTGSADGGDVDISGYQITFGLTASR